MNKNFAINDYQIDISRNQIEHNGSAETLQPKMISVLIILAKHQGQVVSHDHLMDEVWSDRSVSPNTLQRCIAQLRKALGDDSKTQTIIKTHSKQGYSLEADVRWQTDIATTVTQTANPYRVAAVATVITGILLLSAFFIREPGIQSFETLEPMTASDEKEFYPNYSPDGRYLVFHRYLDVCQNHIWAKDLQTQQEFRLTQEPGVYGPHSWSADGTQLAFILQENCHASPSQLRMCWRLQTLDFISALNGPVAPVQRLDCDTQLTQIPKWLNDGNIVMLRQGVKANKLVHYDVRSHTLSDFYQPQDSKLYDFDYSPKSNMLAAVSKTLDGTHKLEQLTTNGEVSTRANIQPPSHFSYYEHFSPAFHHSGKYLITNTNKGLYKLSLNGEMTQLEAPTYQDLYTPTFHPNEDSLVATYGHVDLDIAAISLAQPDSPPASVGFNQVYLPYPSIARSTAYDSSAYYQPNGHLIAFVSNRSGADQLWLFDNKKLWQLSQLPPDSRINGISWSPDGERIALIVDDKLTIVSLSGDYRAIDTERPLKFLQQWNNDNQLLVVADHHQLNEWLKLDLNTLTFTSTGIGPVKWAKVINNDTILFIDWKSRLWKKSGEVVKEISSAPHKFHGKRFVLSQDDLYGINAQDQLWKLNITSQNYQVVKQLKEQVWWPSDIKGDNMLIIQSISSRKEIVKISP
ncbi:winged helix-turn-helix domain-containing protein [Pleionea sp. CnH1-48]|nr:winged helix-turn-helix domain-containing protein [Pleionea sp. CnH1-48]